MSWQILGIKTTYLNRLDTNEFVYEAANQAISQNRKPSQKRRQIIQISDCYETQRRKRIRKNMTQDATDPITNTCIDINASRLESYDTWRVGRPSFTWWEHTIAHYWRYLETFRYSPNTPSIKTKNEYAKLIQLVASEHTGIHIQ